MKTILIVAGFGIMFLALYSLSGFGNKRGIVVDDSPADIGAMIIGAILAAIGLAI